MLNVTTLAAGPSMLKRSVSSASGSVTRAARSMFVGTPASTLNVPSVAAGGRLVGASTSTVTAPATMWPSWSSTV